MKDEEMAEEIANKRCHEIMCFGHCNFSSPKHHRCGEWHREYNCALEGLKAGRPQWHDLRKDPNDLPKFEGDYMCALLNSNYSFILSLAIEDGLKYWQDCEDTDWTNEVIAWCEIPEYKERD